LNKKIYETLMYCCKEQLIFFNCIIFDL
jgi:hypothetical protein